MKILAIESTCDETAAAIVESCGAGVRVISNVVASSIQMHQKYGGIVPEVAAREQLKSIIPVIVEAIGEERNEIEAIAVSYGPGLMGSLLVGVETAKVLSFAWNKPLIRVNHMAAHLYANWIVENETQRVPTFPAIGLVISGGHTDILAMKDLDSWEWVGGTRDDAAGEAFDKAARILGLPYPGGPSIQKAIDQLNKEQNIEKHKKLPRPMIGVDSLEMSFSGLKAAIVRKVQEEKITDDLEIALLAKDFNQAVTDILVSKMKQAIVKYQPKCILMAGGVAANKMIRTSLEKEAASFGIEFFAPEIKYCGDNAAMVGTAAIVNGKTTSNELLNPNPGLMTVE